VITRLLISAFFLLPLACAQLPTITPRGGAFAPGTGGALASPGIFPEGAWQFLHSIRAEMPGARNFTMLGLTVISSRLQTRRSVIMSLEGFVIFDGEYDRRVVVHRAFPPFDSPHFAEGLLNDIGLIFFEPEGSVIGVGELENGSLVRRYRTPDGRTVDVEALPDQDWRVRQYSSGMRLTRTVRFLRARGGPSGFPATIELTACGEQAYRLVMTLVEAVRVEPQNAAGSRGAGFHTQKDSTEMEPIR
jgi:hypothetical protein